MSNTSSRRRLLIAAALPLGAVLAGGIAGCGFELRRAPVLKFKTIQLANFARHSPLACGSQVA